MNNVLDDVLDSVIPTYLSEKYVLIAIHDLNLKGMTTLTNSGKVFRVFWHAMCEYNRDNQNGWIPDSGPRLSAAIIVAAYSMEMALRETLNMPANELTMLIWDEYNKRIMI